MSDPRLTLALQGTAALDLEGVAPAERYLPATLMRCAVSSAPLRGGPEASSQQEDQLLFGEAFDVLIEDGGFAFGQARRDGYVGWVPRATLEPGALEPTHWVSALRTYAFLRPDPKAPNVLTLSMNSLVTVEDAAPRFLKVAGAGWVFEGHLTPIGQYLDDPAAIAQHFLGAPYQWGGRESTGLDCSGLVQQALYACGRACPRDTDMQAAALGAPVEAPARNTLIFWEGHVGLLLDESRLLHANSHHMQTAIEPLDEALARIATLGFQPTTYRQLPFPPP